MTMYELAVYGLSSPHAWGCFPKKSNQPIIKFVFPTCVGVFPSFTQNLLYRHCLPHMRGGVSWVQALREPRRMSSPHAWGCFYHRADFCYRRRVFPTCVGVFPLPLGTSAPVFGLPHMRGGVSMRPAIIRGISGSSPHAWGCFYCLQPFREQSRVFPTCVGVFLNRIKTISFNGCLPHMRGGVSINLGVKVTAMKSSPHAWGCFHLLK